MKTIVVLGMHRSATSLVAKGLHNEIHMGEKLLGPNPSQPLGHFENCKAISLNARILKAAGGSYLKPPPEDRILALADRFRDDIRQFIEENTVEPIWGWKDPRTTLTIRLFWPHLVNPHVVACFRNVDEVAASLLRRGDTKKPGIATRCALEYNLRLVQFLADVYCDVQSKSSVPVSICARA